MTAEQLRNSILQEAISGRLVPQDPNDEPAEIVSTVPEDEVPFEIPSTWRWVNFFSVYTLETNLVDPILYFDYNHIAPDNIVKKQGKLLKCNTVREDKVKSNNHLFHKGQIIYSKIRPLLRKAIIAPFDGLCSADMYPLSTTMDTQFALIYLLSDAFNNQVSSICASRVKMPKINKAELATIVVPLPPLPEQKRIVAKLEELLPIVEQYGKAQKELDELNAALPARLRQSILQEAVQGKLTSHDAKDDWAHNFKKQLPPLKIKSNPEWPTEFPFDLPESWEWCRVGDICDILNGYAFKSDKYVESGINVIRISNVQDGKIIDKDNKYISLSMEKEIEDYMLREKDLLMSLTGNVGRVGLLPKSMLPAALNQRVACLRLKDESIKPFLLWYLQSPVFRERCESSGHGMAQLNISTEWLKQEYFPLPPLAEQQRIVAKIEELLADINKISK